MKLQALLGDRLELRAAGRSANLSFEPQLLRAQRGATGIKVAQLRRCGDPERATEDDAAADDEEPEQQEGESHAPATRPTAYAARRHTRSFALRAREFTAISAASAMIARRVTTVPSE